MPRRHRNAFTLIEVLTVTIIVGILLAVGIPSMNSLIKSGGLTSATRQVANSLGLARQYAITRRTTTRVVFPYQAAATTSMWFQSYSVVASNRSLQAWQYVGRWEFLPAGTTFRNTGVGSVTTLSASLLPFPANGSSTVTMAYIEFNPTGAATQDGALTISEGYADNAGVPVYTSSANISTLSVDSLVGRIKVARP
jgi:prepilin-type N-terminal cleavage/methylation domain-containing protein